MALKVLIPLLSFIPLPHFPLYSPARDLLNNLLKTLYICPTVHFSVYQNNSGLY